MPRRAAVVGAPDLGADDVAEPLVDHGVQVEGVAHPKQVRRDDGADVATQQTRGVAVGVFPQLVGVAGVGAAGLGIDDRMAGIPGADQDHRRTPVPGADPISGEGVAEHRHQLSVSGLDRGAEVGAHRAELVREAGAGQVFDLARGRFGAARY